MLLVCNCDAVERANLGCRTLMYHNFSKILTGVTADLNDWVVSTRLKSAKLLYMLLVNEEDNVTQHLDKVLTTLYTACRDDEPAVVQHVRYINYSTNSATTVCSICSAGLLYQRLLQVRPGPR